MTNSPTSTSGTNGMRAVFTGSLAAAAVALAAGLVAGTSFAPAPAVVCHVDVPEVFTKCSLNANLRLRVNAVRDQLNANVEQLTQRVQAKKDEIELFEANSDRWTAAQQEIQSLVGSLNAEMKYADSKFQTEQAKAIREMYASMKAVIATYADGQGIDYVLLDDSVEALPRMEPDKTRDQALQRRILFAAPARDITQAILLEMNKAYPLVPGATSITPPPPTTGSAAPSGPASGNG